MKNNRAVSLQLISDPFGRLTSLHLPSKVGSVQYRGVLALQHFVQSMSCKGNCWDNAMVESFFHTLKVERVYRQKYRTRAEARADVQDYIERFYNNWRMHSALEYKCPTQYERDCLVAA